MPYQVKTFKNGIESISFTMPESSDGDRSIENTVYRAKHYVGWGHKPSRIEPGEKLIIIAFHDRPDYEIQVEDLGLDA